MVWSLYLHRVKLPVSSSQQGSRSSSNWQPGAGSWKLNTAQLDFPTALMHNAPSHSEHNCERIGGAMARLARRSVFLLAAVLWCGVIPIEAATIYVGEGDSVQDALNA